MALTANEKWALGFAALVVGGGGLLWLLDAATDPDPRKAPVPKFVKDRLAVVVKTLDDTFGKKWGHRALVDLKRVVASALPSWEPELIDHVYNAERTGIAQGWTGGQKLAYAVQLAGA